jgi:hypothetical protein
MIVEVVLAAFWTFGQFDWKVGLAIYVAHLFSIDHVMDNPHKPRTLDQCKKLVNM